jgi:DNA-directed RNA polymerase subunit RPC12/RpoP
MNTVHIPESIRLVVKPGVRVAVCFGSGLDSGKVGVVVDARRPEYRQYIAKEYQGRYSDFNHKTEALVRTDSGDFFTMFKNRLVRPTNQIDLMQPVRSERVRGFQPPWYTVYVYICPRCGNEVRMKASSFFGKTPKPSTGAIICPHCG